MTVPENTIDTMPIQQHSWRPFLVRLHFYAGVLVAPFLIVAAITGGLYALAPTLERFVYDGVLAVDPSGAPLPLREQAAAARAAFPDLTMTGMRPPAAATESTRIYFADPVLDDESLRAVFVDPYSATVLGDEATWFGHLPLSTWLDGLHRHLNLGEPGRIYSEIAASWLWVVALGGLCLWGAKAAGDRRRGRQGGLLTVDRSTTGRTRTMNWHGAVGVWLLTGLLFLSATGITWSTYAGAHVSDLRTAFDWQRPQLDTTLSAAPDGDHWLDSSSIDYDAVLAAAAGAAVHSPVELTLPARPGQAVHVAEIDKPYRLTTNAAAVDPTELVVTSEIDYRRDYSVIAALADWGIRAHMGSLFGLLNQLLLFGVAAGLLTVIVRGYRMWWQRRPTRGSDWALGRPPARGALRRLPPAAVIGLIVAAVGIGWLLPLFGLTLAAFVVVDLAVGAIKARRTVGSEADRHA